MGVFSVPIRVTNWQNRFLLPDERGEDLTFGALVDSGAVELCLPEDLVERLRLVPLGTMAAETADGRRHRLRVMGMAEVEVQGRRATVQVVELPLGAQPLLGAIPLEEMDWHISSKERRLVVNPRSPDEPLLPLL